MRTRAAMKLANERDQYVDRILLDKEASDREKQLGMQKQEPLETWNLPEDEEEGKAFSAGFKVRAPKSDVIESLNDELEVDTYDFMKDDPDYYSDDGLNDGRDDDW